jgi:hypothetical protein
MDTQITDVGAKPAKPSDAFGDADRRRGMVSFLTWAFFLSEAFKTMQADAAGPRATDDLDGATSAASLADTRPEPLSAEPVAYNEWPIALPADPIDKFPPVGHLPQIPEVNLGEPDDLSLARGRIDAPPAFGGGGSSGGGGGASLGDSNPDMQAQLGAPLVDAGDNLDIDASLSLASASDPLDGIFGSPVLTLNNIVGETVLPVVSDLTTVVSSALNSLTAGLLGGTLGSSGLIDILGGSGSHDSGNELFSAGKYTDYHLALQADDRPTTLSGDHEFGIGLDLGDLAGGLIPALGQPPDVSSHDAAAPGIGLPSVIDELLLRGPLDILT